MDIVAEIAASLGDDWLPELYRTKVRSQRTRSVTLEIPERENNARILHTLLGIELQVGKRRFACPDLATARYMRIFARLGCGEFAIPYDITKVSTAADILETAWQRSLLLLDKVTAARTPRGALQVKARLVREIRTRLLSIGPGEAMPAFDRPTRQR